MNGIKIWRRIKYFLLRLFRLKESPHQVSMGVVLGFVPNWFPTFGLGPILSVGIAKLGKGNLVAAFIGGVIGTPLWPFLFLLNYRVGSFLLTETSRVNDLHEVEYVEAFNHMLGNLGSGSLIFLIGAIFNTLVFSIPLYLVVYLIFSKFRRAILFLIK